jgi:hypothetical protein
MATDTSDDDFEFILVDAVTELPNKLSPTVNRIQNIHMTLNVNDSHFQSSTPIQQVSSIPHQDECQHPVQHHAKIDPPVLKLLSSIPRHFHPLNRTPANSDSTSHK